MDFTFTEEQRMMASAFRELADDLCSPAEIRALFEGHTNADTASRWSRLCELGLTGLLAPEPHGLGLTDVDFVLIAEEAGRVALPEPLIEHAGIAVPLLAELTTNTRVAELLPRAASGEALVVVAHPQNPFVNYADQAQYLLICRDEEIHLVEREKTRLNHQPSIDALRRLLTVDATLSTATRVASGNVAKAATARALERGALYSAAQCAGLTARMITIAADYAKERTQFGKPIGSYQAIKHHLSTVQVKLEFARPVLYAAATRASDVSDRTQVAISHAKLAATAAADLAARTAIQVHGAMGYSWEVDLHFYMKRAWALAGAWGDRNFHARRLQTLLFNGAFDRELI